MANRRRRKRKQQGERLEQSQQAIEARRAQGVVAKFERQQATEMAAARAGEQRESIAQQRRELDAQGTHEQRVEAARVRAVRGQAEGAARVRGVIQRNIAARPQRHEQALEVAGRMDAVGQARMVVAKARQAAGGQGVAPPPESVVRAQKIIAQAGAKPGAAAEPAVRLGAALPTTQPAEAPTAQAAPSEESQEETREIVKDRLQGRVAYERAKRILETMDAGRGNALGQETSGHEVVMRVRRIGDKTAGQAIGALEEMAGQANRGSVPERESMLTDIDKFVTSQGIDLANSADPRVAAVAARINMARKGLEVQRIVETKATAKEKAKAKVKSPEQMSIESLVDLMGKADPEQRRAALDLFEQKHGDVDLKKYPGAGEAVQTARARLKEEAGQERRGELTTLIDAANVEDYEAAATALRQIDEEFKPGEQEKLELKGQVDIVRERLGQEARIGKLRRLEKRHGARLKVLEGRRDKLESERAAAGAAIVTARQEEEDSLARSALSETAPVLDKTRVIALHHTRMVAADRKLKEVEPKIEAARQAYNDAVGKIDDYYGSLEREATAGYDQLMAEDAKREAEADVSGYGDVQQPAASTTQPATQIVDTVRQRLEAGESWSEVVKSIDPAELTEEEGDALDELRKKHRK